MKKWLFIIGLIMKMVFIKSFCYASDSSCNNDSTIIADTVRVVYYLDGKQVPYSTIREKGQKGELGDGKGTDNPKEAIRLYGEKYRYGVFFINSKEKK